MAWTSAAEVMTSAKLNAGTAAGVATTSGGLIVATGTNTITERIPGFASTLPGAITCTGTNTTYLSLANLTGGAAFGSEIEVTVTTGAKALVFFSSVMRNLTTELWTLLSFSVSGATTIAAADSHAIWFESPNATFYASYGTFHMPTLTPGVNVFTLAARVQGGEGQFTYPKIGVIPL